MLQLLYRYANLMYHQLVCRIRHHFAPRGLTRFYGLSFTKRFSRTKGLDTNALSSYYKRFNYVVRIKLTAFHPTFCISHLLSRLTYSWIKLYYSHPANETVYVVLTCCQSGQGIHKSSCIPYTGVIIVCRLPYRRQ